MASSLTQGQGGSVDMISFLNSDNSANSGTSEMYCEMDDCVGNASLRCPACKLAMCMKCHSVHAHPPAEVKESGDAGQKAKAPVSARKEVVDRKKQKASPPPKEEKKARSVFEPYWDLAQVEADIQAGRLKKGVLEVPESKKDHATFRAADGTVLTISGWERRNRSLDGDTVAIQFHPNDESRIVYNYTPFAGREFAGKLALSVDLTGSMVAFSCSDIKYPPFLTTLPPSCVELLKTHMVRPSFKLKATKWEASSKWPLGEPASEEELEKAIREKSKQEKAKGGGKSVAAAGSTPVVRKTYKPHVSADELKAGLEAGEFFEGTLRIVSPRDAFVTVKGLDVDVYLEGRKARNRAYDGDKVAIRIGPKTEWKIITEEKRVPHFRRGTFDGEEGRFDFPEEFHPARALAIDGSPLPQPTGSVVYVLHRPIDPVKVGFLDVSTSPDKVALFKPLDLKAPFAVLPKRDWPKEFQNVPAGAAKHFYVARFNQWKVEDTQPLCSLVGPAIGHPGTPEAETRVMLTECNVNYDQNGEFSPEVLAEAQQLLAANLSQLNMADRVDFRNKKLFSVDLTEANDVECGFSFDKHADNTVTVGVHVTDVAWFMRKESKIDQEARFRGCTVSLVQKNLPMLPRSIGENLCSLNPGKDRLAFSVLFKLTRDGKLVTGEKPQFRRSIVRSACKLDHKTAQLIIDHQPTSEEGLPDELKEPLLGIMRPEGERVIDLVNDVLLLHELGIARRKNRFATEGPVTLKHIKINFQLDAQQQPVGFEPHVHTPSHHAVEELKMLANRFVAEQILEKAQDSAILLRQGPPDKSRLDKVVHILQTMGVGLQTGSAGLLQSSLNHFSNSHYRGGNVKSALEKLCLAPMQNAQYVCPGQIAADRVLALQAAQAFSKLTGVASPETKNDQSVEDEYRHYSKNLPAYTHFTSPLRRYADLEVQRLLTWTLDPSVPPPHDVKTAAEIADHCNFRYDWAKKAFELSSRIYLSIYLHHKHPQGWEEKGMIVEVASRSFKVLVFRLGLEHRIQLNEVECSSVKITDEKILEIRHIDGSLEARQVFDEVQMLLYGSIEPPCQIQFRIKPRQPITALNPRGAFSPRSIMIPGGVSIGGLPPGFSPRANFSPRTMSNPLGVPPNPSPRVNGRPRGMPIPPALVTEHSGDGKGPRSQKNADGRGSYNKGEKSAKGGDKTPKADGKSNTLGSPKEDSKTRPPIASPKGDLGSPNSGKGKGAKTPTGGAKSAASTSTTTITTTSTTSSTKPDPSPRSKNVKAVGTPKAATTPKATSEKTKLTSNEQPVTTDKQLVKKAAKDKEKPEKATNKPGSVAKTTERTASGKYTGALGQEGTSSNLISQPALTREKSSSSLSATSAVFSPSAGAHATAKTPKADNEEKLVKPGASQKDKAVTREAAEKTSPSTLPSVEPEKTSTEGELAKAAKKKAEKEKKKALAAGDGQTAAQTPSTEGPSDKPADAATPPTEEELAKAAKKKAEKDAKKAKKKAAQASTEATGEETLTTERATETPVIEGAKAAEKATPTEEELAKAAKKKAEKDAKAAAKEKKKSASAVSPTETASEKSAEAKLATEKAATVETPVIVAKPGEVATELTQTSEAANEKAGEKPSEGELTKAAKKKDAKAAKEKKVASAVSEKPASTEATSEKPAETVAISQSPEEKLSNEMASEAAATQAAEKATPTEEELAKAAKKKAEKDAKAAAKEKKKSASATTTQTAPDKTSGEAKKAEQAAIAEAKAAEQVTASEKIAVEKAAAEIRAAQKASAQYLAAEKSQLSASEQVATKAADTLSTATPAPADQKVGGSGTALADSEVSEAQPSSTRSTSAKTAKSPKKKPRKPNRWART